MTRVMAALLLLAFGLQAQAITWQSTDKEPIEQNAKAKPTPESVPQHSRNETEAEDKAAIDWGEWDTTPTSNPQYGVGIKGKTEWLINQLDKSDLVTNADGVTTQKRDHKQQQTQPKNISEMMAELRAMEKKLKKEVEDDTEF